MFLIVSYLVGALIGLQQGKNINIHDDNGSIDIVDRFSQMNQFARFAYIAKNNLTVSIKNLVFGIFSLGFFSVIYTFYNGLFSGIVIGTYSSLNLILSVFCANKCVLSRKNTLEVSLTNSRNLFTNLVVQCQSPLSTGIQQLCQLRNTTFESGCIIGTICAQ